uniref:Uncharacterized protein n=1 Tax=Amphimedon queenslandica TaxID=400682 RepID=A0A1X7UJM1_AMPQE
MPSRCFPGSLFLTFTELLVQDQTRADICLLSNKPKQLPLSTDALVNPDDPTSGTVFDHLVQKHPMARPVSPGAVVPSTSGQDPHPILFHGFDCNLVKGGSSKVFVVAGFSEVMCVGLPIGIGETCHKALFQLALVSLGCEASVHAMKVAFNFDGSDAMLLVDATNLFINGQTILSPEGTTQGDPLAMSMYALATVPLINCISSVPVVQTWYTDNASAADDVQALSDLLDFLV